MSSDEKKFDPLLGHQHRINSNVQHLEPLIELHLDSSLGYSPVEQTTQVLDQTNHLNLQEASFHHQAHHTQSVFNVHATDILNIPAGPSLNAPSPPDSSSPVSMSSSPIPPVLLTLGVRSTEHLGCRQPALHVPIACSNNGYNMAPNAHHDIHHAQHQTISKLAKMFTES